MEMKLKSKKIKELRRQKLWSQEELAAASSLSLRTIQRIEKDGISSVESLKALASVLEVNADDITANEKNASYRHTQIGWTMLTIFSCALFVDIFFPAPPYFSLVIILIALAVSTLTISVNDNELTWYFGPRIIKKSKRINEISSCEIVNNKWWWGWGLRLRPLAGYWLYNVSGLEAVEVTLKSGNKFRLGTDEPNYLYQAINNAIKDNED